MSRNGWLEGGGHVTSSALGAEPLSFIHLLYIPTFPCFLSVHRSGYQLTHVLLGAWQLCSGNKNAGPFWGRLAFTHAEFYCTTSENHDRWYSECRCNWIISEAVGKLEDFLTVSNAFHTVVVALTLFFSFIILGVTVA